jgi:hypothetical protein
MIYDATGLQIGLGDLDHIPPDWLDAIFALQVEVPRKKMIIDRVKQGK